MNEGYYGCSKPPGGCGCPQSARRYCNWAKWIPKEEPKVKKFHFDVRAAIPLAWNFLWAKNLETRKKDEADFARTGHKAYRDGSTYYLCAADIENQIRAWAEDTAAGKPWRKERVYGGYGFQVRLSGDLQGMVRDFLLRGNGGKIVGHNFGRGHISGMRFRPVGEPLSEAEKNTLDKKQKQRDNPRPTTWHYSERYGSRPECVRQAAIAKGQRIYGFRPSKALTTRDLEEVTCPRCKNLIAQGKIDPKKEE